MKASFNRDKQNEGKWLIKAETEDPFEELPAANSEIEVTLKSGEKKTVTVTRLIWSGDAYEGSGKAGLYALD